MTKIAQEVRCSFGPYKSYFGRAEYDPEIKRFHGEVLGVRDVVTFQGTTPDELATAFAESVDDYLAFCAERGEKPDKPFSGRFVARIAPKLHRKLSTVADIRGQSLNQLICEMLESAAASMEPISKT